MSNRYMLRVPLSDEARAALHAAAAESGVPAAEIARRAIAKYLREPIIAEMRPAHRPPPPAKTKGKMKS